MKKIFALVLTVIIAFSALLHRGIAQLVEQRSPKPRAGSSSLSTPAKTRKTPDGVFFVFGGV